MNILVILWIFTRFCNIQNQEISVSDYSQEDSETKCTYGLINNLDTFMSKCQVELFKNTTFKTLEFQVQKKQDAKFFPLSHFDIQEQSSDSHLFNCNSRRDNVTLCTLKQKASKDYDRARFRVALRYGVSRQILSDVHMYPTITDLNDTKLQFLVNGEEITPQKNKDGCVMNTFKDDIIFIDYFCKSKARPCLIEVNLNEKNISFYKDSAHISLQGLFDARNQINVTARFAACRLEGTQNSVTCTFRLDQKTVTEVVIQNYILYGLLVMLILINIGLLFITLYRRKKMCVKTKNLNQMKALFLEQRQESNVTASMENEMFLQRQELFSAEEVI
ncbi:unnamed protein product [Lymnaea stagnalis]|uniref:Uncharacterized protein n=1 Tax=Lymnaea stagnalis TaxID=6523 RepID=A0AAV2HPF7_LYMST